MAKVEFFNVSYIEKGDIILKNIDVSIDKGELFMVKAPNPREGKAFLRIAHRFINPTEGSVKISVEEGDFVGTNIIPFISEFIVEEVLSLPLLAKGYSKIEIQSKVRHITSYFSIEGILGKRVEDLTNSEKALLGVAKAVIAEPSLVILDSFSEMLEHKYAVLVMAYLHEISVDYNVTVIMVENDTKLHPFAGKILQLENGYVKDLVGEGVDLHKLMPFLKI